MKGSSCAHCVHQEAKKLTSTGLPLRLEMLNCPPPNLVAVKSGAMWPRAGTSAETVGSGGAPGGRPGGNAPSQPACPHPHPPPPPPPSHDHADDTDPDPRPAVPR